MILRWVVLCVWCAVIFHLSAQTGTASSGLSQRITDVLVQILAVGGIDAEHWRMVFLVRKAAHLTEFAVLGALTAWAWHPNLRPPRRPHTQMFWSVAGPLLIGSLFAVTDELHQVFVPGRAGQWQDVGIDVTGVAIGVGAVFVIRHRHHPDRAGTSLDGRNG